MELGSKNLDLSFAYFNQKPSLVEQFESMGHDFNSLKQSHLKHRTWCTIKENGNCVCKRLNNSEPFKTMVRVELSQKIHAYVDLAKNARNIGAETITRDIITCLDAQRDVDPKSRMLAITLPCLDTSWNGNIKHKMAVDTLALLKYKNERKQVQEQPLKVLAGQDSSSVFIDSVQTNPNQMHMIEDFSDQRPEVTLEMKVELHNSANKIRMDEISNIKPELGVETKFPPENTFNSAKNPTRNESENLALLKQSKTILPSKDGHDEMRRVQSTVDTENVYHFGIETVPPKPTNQSLYPKIKHRIQKGSDKKFRKLPSNDIPPQRVYFISQNMYGKWCTKNFPKPKKQGSI
jgi:hypothetical protein